MYKIPVFFGNNVSNSAAVIDHEKLRELPIVFVYLVWYGGKIIKEKELWGKDVGCRLDN